MAPQSARVGRHRGGDGLRRWRGNHDGRRRGTGKCRTLQRWRRRPRPERCHRRKRRGRRHGAELSDGYGPGLIETSLRGTGADCAKRAIHGCGDRHSRRHRGSRRPRCPRHPVRSCARLPSDERPDAPLLGRARDDGDRRNSLRRRHRARALSGIRLSRECGFGRASSQSWCSTKKQLSITR